jgi:dipeptidyl aminopeptidase/acylaminoacyl peptidase
VFSHSPTPKADDWRQADLSLVEVASGTARLLADSRAAEADPAFSPDGRWIAYTASDVPPTWAGASGLQIVAVDGATRRALAPSYDGRPNVLGWSADGRRIFVSETYRTVSRVWAIPAEGGQLQGITPVDLMVESPALNAARTHFGFTSQTAEQPVEAFIGAVDPFAPVQVSRVQNPAKVTLGRTEAVEWKSPDGKSIEGLLTYPAGYQAGTRVPLLVIVHGGPAGVFLRTFTGNPSPYLVAAFASRGYALLRCNVRGSSGYGRDFRYANRSDWGGGDYRDILSGLDHLISKGIADPERLGVMGWSYGGYMTSWVITQTKRFKAASVGAGVTNLMSFTGTADIPSFVPDYFEGEYWDVFDRWRTHSAMFNVKGVSTPTLIQHGDADVRVPISQGFEFYNALKRQNVPVTMVVYPRQPHGIQEPKMMLDAMQRNLDWFDRWIKGTQTSKEGHYLFTPK